MHVFLIKGEQPLYKERYSNYYINCHIDNSVYLDTFDYNIKYGASRKFYIIYRIKSKLLEIEFGYTYFNIDNENIKAIFDDIYQTVREYVINGKPINQELIDGYFEQLDELFSVIYPLSDINKFASNMLETKWDQYFNKRCTKR